MSSHRPNWPTRFVRMVSLLLSTAERLTRITNFPFNSTDFDECSSAQFHDCSENSYCFNLRGTYTCSCRDGFVDLSENPIYPGRICSGELIGCEKCNYHGTCYSAAKGEADPLDDTETELCECFQWYAGASCQYNLKSKYPTRRTIDQKIGQISFFFYINSQFFWLHWLPLVAFCLRCYSSASFTRAGNRIDRISDVGQLCRASIVCHIKHWRVMDRAKAAVRSAVTIHPSAINEPWSTTLAAKRATIHAICHTLRKR